MCVAVKAIDKSDKTFNCLIEESHMEHEIKSNGRVVQTFVIKVGGSRSEDKKQAKTRGGSTRGATPPTEPDAEVITSQHVESRSAKTRGRHVG